MFNSVLYLPDLFFIFLIGHSLCHTIQSPFSIFHLSRSLFSILQPISAILFILFWYRPLCLFDIFHPVYISPFRILPQHSFIRSFIIPSFYRPTTDELPVQRLTFVNEIRSFFMGISVLYILCCHVYKPLRAWVVHDYWVLATPTPQNN